MFPEFHASELILSAEHFSAELILSLRGVRGVGPSLGHKGKAAWFVVENAANCP